MTKEVKEKLKNFAKELSKSSDKDEKITAAIIFTTLGSIAMGNLSELEDLMFNFTEKQIAIIKTAKKLSHMRQN